MALTIEMASIIKGITDVCTDVVLTESCCRLSGEVEKTEKINTAYDHLINALMIFEEIQKDGFGGVVIAKNAEIPKNEGSTH